jgi:hypothetical protein
MVTSNSGMSSNHLVVLLVVSSYLDSSAPVSSAVDESWPALIFCFYSSEVVPSSNLTVRVS